MSYHGMLRPQFGPYYVDVDLPDTAAQRAKSVRMVADRIIDGSWTATLLTAAWIHLGGQPPEMLEAATASSHRGTSRSKLIPTALRHCDYLQREDVGDEDLRVIGGVVVTSPELTIEDLLRIGGHARHQDIAWKLCAFVEVDILRQRLLSGVPGSDSVRQFLKELEVRAG